MTQTTTKQTLASHAAGRKFTELVANFTTIPLPLKLGKEELICTVNEREYHNSPICSPYNLFFLYPEKKLQDFENRFLKHLILIALAPLKVVFKQTRFNRVIQVNNKPCDAIAYPEASPEEIQQSLDKMVEEHPSHAILFPRIDPTTHPLLFENLTKMGFEMVPTKPMHIFSPQSPFGRKSRNKRDRSLLKKTPYQLVEHDELDENDLARIHQLYQKLFREKHTLENPDLTLSFFKKCHQNEWYRFFALRNSTGEIDAFFSYEVIGNVMACGPLGYDTSLPKEEGLYRMLFTHSLSIAEAHDYLFNFGGGNEKFKLNRGSIREIGYTAVYARHLPLYRRLPWKILAVLGRLITVPILKKNLIK